MKCIWFKGNLKHIFPLEILCCLYEIVCSVYIGNKYFTKDIFKTITKSELVKDKLSVK